MSKANTLEIVVTVRCRDDCYNIVGNSGTSDIQIPIDEYNKFYSNNVNQRKALAKIISNFAKLQITR